MEDKEKIYNNIYAYKGVGITAILYMTLSSFISFFACTFLIMATVRINFLYLIGVIPTGIFGLWSIGMFIKKRAFPDLILKQQDDSIYLYPDTKNQVILPLADIVEVTKKNSSFVLGSGQLIITSKTNRYLLNINELDRIYKNFTENINKNPI